MVVDNAIIYDPGYRYHTSDDFAQLLRYTCIEISYSAEKSAIHANGSLMYFRKCGNYLCSVLEGKKLFPSC